MNDNEIIFTDYIPAKNCCNLDTYGAVCLKCGECGRKFENGILQEGGEG